MRPLAGEKPKQLEKIGARDQHRRRATAGDRGKAGRDCGMPVAVDIVGAGKIRHEEEIEMCQVVGQVLRGLHQVPGQAAIPRHLDGAQVGQRRSGSGRLRHRTDTADARHDNQRILRRATDQYLLETAKQRRIDARRHDLTGVDIETDFKVAFDAIEGPEDNAPHLLGFLTAGRTTG